MTVFMKLAVGSALLGAWTFPLGQTQKPEPENIWVNASCDETLDGKQVLISIISDGKIVAQKETNLPFASVLFSKVPGEYFIKLEGRGMQTLTKGPYQVIKGESLNTMFAMEPGVGATVVQYGSSPMSREEVATRIKRLEEAVVKLQKGGQ